MIYTHENFLIVKIYQPYRFWKLISKEVGVNHNNMIKIITSIEEYNKLTDKQLVAIECCGCHMTFDRKKAYIKGYIKDGTKNCYCSNACQAKFTLKKDIKVNCTQCNKEIIRKPYQFKKEYQKKNGRKGIFFCSMSCSGTYKNKHREYGYRRSKMETYIQKILTWLYPNLDIKYNNNEAIGYELDIYIPNLKLAFELNGIFHYMIVYKGQGCLERIQNNDRKKSQLCIENGIDLCVLDVSKEKHFKEKHATKYLNIITDIINAKLENREFIPDYERYR